MAPFDFKEGAHPVTGEPLVDRDPGDENDHPPIAPLDEGRAKLEALRATTAKLAHEIHCLDGLPIDVYCALADVEEALDAFDD